MTIENSSCDAFRVWIEHGHDLFGWVKRYDVMNCECTLDFRLAHEFDESDYRHEVDEFVAWCNYLGIAWEVYRVCDVVAQNEGEKND